MYFSTAGRSPYLVAVWDGCLFFFAGMALLCCCLTTCATPTFNGWVAASVTWFVNKDGCCMIALYWFPCEWEFLKGTGRQSENASCSLVSYRKQQYLYKWKIRILIPNTYLCQHIIQCLPIPPCTNLPENHACTLLQSSYNFPDYNAVFLKYWVTTPSPTPR